LIMRLGGVYETRGDSPYVKYEKSSEAIRLVPIRGESEEMAEGRPWQFTTTLMELIDGKPNGEYTVVSQGALIYGFTYKGKNGKVVEFHLNEEAYDPDQPDCVWK
ncbi:hypothetical protein ACYCAX_15680, partial [Pseudomonas sp. MT3]